MRFAVLTAVLLLAGAASIRLPLIQSVISTRSAQVLTASTKAKPLVLKWDEPSWTNALKYEVWAEWPMWTTNEVFIAAGVVTNRFGIRTNIEHWETNISWTFSPPKFWQTVSTNFVEIDPSTNAGGRFVVRSLDTKTGFVSWWAK